MSPTYSPTPLPVHIANFPGPDAVAWATLVFAFLTLVVSGMGVWYAVRTLLVTAADFELNLKQARAADDERSRKPNLYLAFEDGADTREVSVTAANVQVADRYPLDYTLRCYNDGIVPATNVTVFVSFPLQVKSTMEFPAALPHGMPVVLAPTIEEYHKVGTFAFSLRQRKEDGSREDEWGIGIVKHGDYKDIGRLGILVPVGVTEFRCLVTCDQGTFPPGDKPQVLTINVTKS